MRRSSVSQRPGLRILTLPRPCHRPNPTRESTNKPCGQSGFRTSFPLSSVSLLLPLAQPTDEEMHHRLRRQPSSGRRRARCGAVTVTAPCEATSSSLIRRRQRRMGTATTGSSRTTLGALVRWTTTTAAVVVVVVIAAALFVGPVESFGVVPPSWAAIGRLKPSRPRPSSVPSPSSSGVVSAARGLSVLPAAAAPPPTLRSSWALSSSLSANDASPRNGDDDDTASQVQTLNRFQARLVRIGLQLYVVGMCVALPATLLPQRLLRKLRIVSTKRSQIMALSTGQFCSRWLLRLIPFCNIRIYKLPKDNKSNKPLEPSIWVCNHMSMLDVFVLLGVDRQLRGKRKRPIKIVYWKGLEANPITRLLFRQAGFIPVQMADNGNGNDNEYDVKSFKKLLKDAKEAFADGFDIGVLPEGQLNPTPEKGLMPVFSGAYTLAKLSKRPIQMMALYGTNRLWDALEGMCCTSRVVKVKAYPYGRKYESAHEFVDAFTNVVGTFGMRGYDLPEPDLTRWLTGTTTTTTTTTTLTAAAASSTASKPESTSASTASTTAAAPPKPSSKQSA